MDLSTARNRLAVTAARMQAVSPLGTLERGYAIVQDENKTVIRDASKLKPEQRIIGRLARGRFEAVVKKIRSD
jgi:exodeoxyribonuclease VII large subunit